MRYSFTSSRSDRTASCRWSSKKSVWKQFISHESRWNRRNGQRPVTWCTWLDSVSVLLKAAKLERSCFQQMTVGDKRRIASAGQGSVPDRKFTFRVCHGFRVQHQGVSYCSAATLTAASKQNIRRRNVMIRLKSQAGLLSSYKIGLSCSL